MKRCPSAMREDLESYLLVGLVMFPKCRIFMADRINSQILFLIRDFLRLVDVEF